MKQKNLSHLEAIKKLKTLAESINFTMMATGLDEKPFHLFPMSTKKVDYDGSIWFLSGKDSDHNTDIERHGKTMLIYSKPSDMKFLKVYGDAYIITDKKILEELYSKSDDMWFNGLDDPNLTAIKISPTEAHYWEPKDNTFITLLKLGMATITGDEPRITSSGKLNL